jgi:hypothetical protein
MIYKFQDTVLGVLVARSGKKKIIEMVLFKTGF